MTLHNDARRVTVLFAHRRSEYWSLPVEVYDERRDARTDQGLGPVVAHPPCRLWCRLRGLSTAPESERDLAYYARDQVRRRGGVLEHPAHSIFWAAGGLPLPAAGAEPVRDEFGGWTLAVNQRWWGHRAEKPTWLYIVGCAPREIPELPLSFTPASHTCGRSTKRGTVLRALEKADRDLTPRSFAWWLEELASRCAQGAS